MFMANFVVTLILASLKRFVLASLKMDMLHVLALSISMRTSLSEALLT
jgi:hypothetical protein